MHEITKEQIIMCHNKMIEKYGGEYGIRDKALLDSACSMPYQIFNGIELFPSVFDKAARYAYGFAGYQIFADGNKRTAIAVTSLFLQANGYDLSLNFNNLYDLSMRIANEENITVKEISSYLRANSYEIPPISLNKMLDSLEELCK